MLANIAADFSPRDRTVSLAAVILSSFFLGMAFGLGYPIAAFQLTAWGASNGTVGLIGAAVGGAIGDEL